MGLIALWERLVETTAGIRLTIIGSRYRLKQPVLCQESTYQMSSISLLPTGSNKEVPETAEFGQNGQIKHIKQF
jgi:hypothetical protein